MNFKRGQCVYVMGSDRLADGTVVEVCAVKGASVLVKASGSPETYWIGAKCLNVIDPRWEGIMNARKQEEHTEPVKETLIKVNDAPWRFM